MFAVLHIADFALHAVLRTERDRNGQPAALFSGTGKKSLVLAANPAARAAGVELGMSAPQAVARCPALVIRAPRADAEAEARAALLAIGFTLSPAIEDTAPGICTIDLKGSDAAKNEKLAVAAIAQLAQLGLPATAGIARTPLLALYAARSIVSSDSEVGRVTSETTSKKAGSVRGETVRLSPGASEKPGLSVTADQRTETCSPRHSPPPGELIFSAPPIEDDAVSSDLLVGESAAPDLARCEPRINPNPPHPASPATITTCVRIITDERNFLAPLSLAAADPSPELSHVFAHWGLRTLGDLTALPRDEIVRRFGAEGLALWQRASGGAPRPLHPVAPRQTFSAEMEFEQEIETLEPLLFILRRFLDRLALELRASQHVAAEQHLTLRLEDETQHTRSFRLPEPTADPEILFRALHTHLESLQTAASIVAVQLRLTPARPLVRQQGLFETGLRDPHGFAETLARVSALVGADRVGTPQLEDTHRPDAVKLVAPLPVVSPDTTPPLHAALSPPLRRFRPPLPARVEFTAGRATYLWTDYIRGEISAQSAPYPSSGDWWQKDRAWQRTEWDIALAEGGLYRLLLVNQTWFIEGEYD